MIALSFLFMVLGFILWIKGSRSLSGFYASQATRALETAVTPSDPGPQQRRLEAADAQRLDELREALIAKERQCEEFRFKLESVQRQADEWRTRYDDGRCVMDRLAAEAVEVIQELKRAWDESKERCRVLAEEHDRLSSLAQQWDVERSEINARQEDWEREKQRLEHEINGMNERMTRLQSALSDKDRRMDDLARDIKTLHETVHQFESVIEPLLNRHRRHTAVLAKIETVLSTVSGEDDAVFGSKGQTPDDRCDVADRVVRLCQETDLLRQKERRMKEELLRLRVRAIGLKKICDAYRRAMKIAEPADVSPS